jgi:hypothetical protein
VFSIFLRVCGAKHLKFVSGRVSGQNVRTEILTAQSKFSSLAKHSNDCFARPSKLVGFKQQTKWFGILGRRVTLYVTLSPEEGTSFKYQK